MPIIGTDIENDLDASGSKKVDKLRLGVRRHGGLSEEERASTTTT